MVPVCPSTDEELAISFPYTDIIIATPVTSGNYLIQYCGNYAPIIQKALQNTHASLQQAIASMDPTSPVYKAFLNGVDANDVKALFGQISAGANIELPNGHLARPTIVCINNHMEPLWSECKQGHRSASAAENTQWIFLCPIFWLVLLPAPLSFHCGSVDSTSKSIEGPDMTQTQYTVLVHELVHLYLGKAKLKPEVYHINDCLALPASQAAINPQNYALYAASKSPHLQPLSLTLTN